MENDEKSYGRRRLKKPRPTIVPRQEDEKERPQETAAPVETPPEVNIPKAEPERAQTTTEHPPRGQQRRPPRRREDRRPGRGEGPRPGPRPEKREYQKDRTRVSIIVPAYNEQENVAPLLKQFENVIRRYRDWEVIYVDDGSTDGTGKAAAETASRYQWLKVVSHNRNQGLTAALDTGFRHARGNILVFYPADLQYHPEDIPKMISRIDRGADIVTGWKQGKYKKKFVSFVFNRICRMLFDIKVHDLNSVKAFKKDVLDNISMRRDWHRYMVVLAAESDYRVEEVKVTIYPREHGRSKFGAGRILGGVLDLFSVKFQISFMKSPLRFFGTWGFIAAFAGFIVGLIAVYLRFFTTHGSRTLLYLVILLILSGLGMFALGFLAEVMVGLRDEINALKKRR